MIKVLTLALITLFSAFASHANATIIQTNIRGVAESIDTTAPDYIGDGTVLRSDGTFTLTADSRRISVSGAISNNNIYHQNLDDQASVYAKTGFQVFGIADNTNIFFTFRLEGNYSMAYGQATLYDGFRTATEATQGRPTGYGYDYTRFEGAYVDYLNNDGGTSGFYLVNDIGRDSSYPQTNLPEKYASYGPLVFDSYAGTYGSTGTGEFGMQVYIAIEGITTAGYTMTMVDAFIVSNGNSFSGLSSRATRSISPYLVFDDGTEMQITVKSVAAVPEPETYSMMLAGLGLIGFTARRKS